LAKGAPALIDAFVEALPNPVLVIGAGQKIGAFNAAARALFPALASGQRLLTLVVRSPDILDAVNRVAKGGPAETVNLHERVPVERLFKVHVAPFQKDAERFVLLSLDDLTDAKRTERMRVDFIANASHELRTPLASLLGFVETLQGAAKDDQKARERFLAIMRDQGRRMARLIDDLLSLSQIERQEHVRPQTQVDFSDVVRQCIDALSPVAKDAHVHLHVDIPAKLPITGDRDELIRVVENLIENAIKYGADDDGAETQVEIVLNEKQGQARFAVRDHGAGIAPEHLPRLTERFYRVDAGKSRAKGGTGLGLALVKHIVARHRGVLRIWSEPDKGAEFSVEIPLDGDA
jgi:two-component system phosphate regulon sensor histidine kinase PhoR